MGRLNCLTCCFEARRKPVPKTKEEAHNVLKNYQIGIYTLLVIQLLIIVLWITLSYVNGFSLYVVDPSIVVSSGWAHSVSHLGLWFALEFIAVWLGAQITYVTTELESEKATESALRRIVVYLIAHIVSMIADVIHIVFTGLEINDKESTLYVQNWGFLVAFLVGYILYLVFVKTWLVYRSVVYYKALEEYAGSELVFALIPYPASSPSSSADDIESKVIRTPLLDQIYKKRAQQKK